MRTLAAVTLLLAGLGSARAQESKPSPQDAPVPQESKPQGQNPQAPAPDPKAAQDSKNPQQNQQQPLPPMPPPAPSPEPPSNDLVNPPVVGETIGLTIEDALRLAMKYNYGLEDARLVVRGTDTSIGVQIGVFDPSYFADVRGGQNQLPSANNLQVGSGDPGDPFRPGPVQISALRTDFFDFRTGFRQKLMTGLQYELSGGSQYAYSQPSPFSALNPNVASNVSIAVTQPLLRGFGTTVNKGLLYQARNETERSRLQLEQLMLDTSFQVLRDYWDFVFTIEAVETRNEAVRVANDLLRINQRKREAGVAIQLDVVAAESEVARRRFELIGAEQARGDAEDTLRRIVFATRDVTEWKQAIVPLTKAEENYESPGTWEDLAVEALRERPDIRATLVDLKTKDIGIVIAENSKLPLLNLTASYGLNGLGWNANSYDPIVKQDFRDFSVGLAFEVPIGNNTAAAQLDLAKIDKARSLVALRDLEDRVIDEVRRGVRDLESGKERVQSAVEAYRLAKETYDSLLRRYEVGMAIIFDVRQAQRDVFEARDAETRAELDYQISKAQVARSRGSLLVQYGLAGPAPRIRSNDIFYE
jgi:outer membrane protein